MSQPAPALAPPPFRSILFLTDFSSCSDAALDFACAIARRYNARLHLAHVVGPTPLAWFGPTRIPYPNVESEAQRASQKMERLSRLPILQDVLHGASIQRDSVWDGVAKLKQRLNIDLIVLGTHGRAGLEYVLLGSVAEQLFRHADCPVLIVGPKARGTSLGAEGFQTVVYATNFSTASSRALEYALTLTRTGGSSLILLHAVQDSTEVAFRYLDDAVHEASQRLSKLIPKDGSSNCRVVATCGPAADVILKVARKSEADLIVMGAHGGSSVWAHAPWTVGHAVVCAAPCPVLTVCA